jgi:hypothetical protein
LSLVPGSVLDAAAATRLAHEWDPA